MATSSIFATVRIDTPSIAEEFVDLYDKHMETSSYLSRKQTPTHLVTNSEMIKKLFEKKFSSKK